MIDPATSSRSAWSGCCGGRCGVVPAHGLAPWLGQACEWRPRGPAEWWVSTSRRGRPRTRAQQLAVAVAVVLEGLAVQAGDGGGELEGHVALGPSPAPSQLLAAARQRERRQVVAVEQRADVVGDEAAGGSAAPERVVDDVEVEPGRAGQAERLRGGHRLPEPQEVDQELDRVAGSGRAHVQDLGSTASQAPGGSVAAPRSSPPAKASSRPSRACSGPPPTGASMARTPALRGQGGDPPGRRRRGGAHVQPAGARRQRADDLRRRGLHLGHPGQHRDRDLGVRTGGRDRVRPAGAGGLGAGPPVASHVGGDDVKPGAEPAARTSAVPSGRVRRRPGEGGSRGRRARAGRCGGHGRAF